MKFSAFIFAALAVLATGGTVWAADNYKFAIIPKAMNSPFYDAARDYCREQAQKIGVECIYKGPIEHEPATQVQIIQDFITSGIDGLAIAVADADSVLKVIQQARDAGIPVITFDSDSPNSVRQAAIGSNNEEIGAELARLLLKLRPEGGTYAMISGGPAAANLQQRIAGVRATLAGSNWQEIPSGSPTYTNDDPALGVQQMHDLKTANPDLGAIIAIGGWPLWAPEAYKNFINRYRNEYDSGKFSVVAADTLEIQLEELRDGYVNGLVGQRPGEMGAMSMDVLLALKEGKQVEEMIYSGLDILTKENVANFLQKD